MHLSSSGYEEAGDQGCFRVKAGEVIFHGQFEAHLDRFSETGAAVLNLPLPIGYSCMPGVAQLADPDTVARVAERNWRDALELLFSLAISRTLQPSDWPDELAAALMRNPSLKLSRWGEANGIAPWTLSRDFAFSVWGLPGDLSCARSRPPCLEAHSRYTRATRKHCSPAWFRRPIAHDPQR